jgi:hypothetical protein
MQNILSKKLNFFIVFILTIVQYAHCQDFSSQLNRADKLFNERKMRSAFVIYDSLQTQAGQFTPAMLLKMAYIKENTGEYERALYYLSLYNQQRPSVKVLEKMDNLADAHGLDGYDFTDLEYFLALYNQFYKEINYGLVGLAIISFLYNTFVQGIKQSYPRSRLVGYLALLAVIFYLINFGLPIYKGIVSGDDSYVMAGPSSGSSYVSTIPKGTRLNIIGKEQAWYRITWSDSTAYVRDSRIWVVARSNKEIGPWQEYFNFTRFF